MKWFIIFILSLFLSININAKEVQWSQGYTGNCDNATHRNGTDSNGNPILLPLSEIYMVRYLIVNKGETDPDNAVYEAQMMGGCKPIFIDTKRYVPPGTYEIYGVTVDTSQPVRLESVLSNPPVELIVTKSKPNPPSGIR